MIVLSRSFYISLMCLILLTACSGSGSDSDSDSDSNWTALVEPGVRLEAHTLMKLGDYINLQPNWSFIYTDDDLISFDGERSCPRFKPDFNIDLLRSSPYIGQAWVNNNDLVSLGGMHPIPGAEQYDLALRWLDLYGEVSMGHIADILLHVPEGGYRPFDSNAGVVALEDHLKRCEISANVLRGYIENSYRIEYLHESTPKVSIIIPTKDKLDIFQPCIESVLGLTDYPNYEVIVVDNQSTDPDTLAFYDELLEKYQERVKVYFYNHPRRYT